MSEDRVDLAAENLTPAETAIEAIEQEALIAQIPFWSIDSNTPEQRLIRTLKFKDFQTALDFVNRVGELAEQADHHPLIELTWGKVIVYWWTHSLGGLHRNDFRMAARTDELVAEAGEVKLS